MLFKNIQINKTLSIVITLLVAGCGGDDTDSISTAPVSESKKPRLYEVGDSIPMDVEVIQTVDRINVYTKNIDPGATNVLYVGGGWAKYNVNGECFFIKTKRVIDCPDEFNEAEFLSENKK